MDEMTVVDWALSHASPLPIRWEKRKVSCPSPRYFLGMLETDRLFLLFVFPSPPLLSPTVPGEVFSEGLWKYDVGELFVRDPHSTRYRELNLAPNGSWWIQDFSEYRVAVEDSLPRDDFEVGSGVIGEGQQFYSWIKVPSHFLFQKPADSFLNICAIVGKSPRYFFSLVDIPTLHPDFHHTDRCEPYPVNPVPRVEGMP